MTNEYRRLIDVRINFLNRISPAIFKIGNRKFKEVGEHEGGVKVEQRGNGSRGWEQKYGEYWRTRVFAN